MSDEKRLGRPSKYANGEYQASMPEVAYKLSLLGCTAAEIAEFFGVNTDTLYLWKNTYPDFSDAVERGRELADAEVVVKLRERAMGYSHADIDIRVVDKEIVQTPITRYYPPDTAAAQFWLKNRQRDKWRDKIETGVTDKDGNDRALDPLEAARAIAFLLAGAEEKLKGPP